MNKQTPCMYGTPPEKLLLGFSWMVGIFNKTKNFINDTYQTCILKVKSLQD